MVDRRQQADEAKKRVQSGMYTAPISNGRGYRTSGRAEAVRLYDEEQEKKALEKKNAEIQKKREFTQSLPRELTNPAFGIESGLNNLAQDYPAAGRTPSLTPGPRGGGVAPLDPADASASRRVSRDVLALQNRQQNTNQRPQPQNDNRGFFESFIKPPPAPSQPWTNDQLNSIITGSGRQGGTVGGINDALNGFGRNVRDSATLGLYPYIEEKGQNSPTLSPYMQPRANYEAQKAEAEKQDGTWAGVAADLVGSAIPYAGAYKLAAPLIGGAVRTMGPIASNFVRGATAGGIYGAANELGEAGFGKNDQHWTERIQDVGISAALGGAGDAAFSALGRGLQKWLPGQRNNANPTGDPLSLPLGQRDARMAAAAQRGVNAPGTNPIADPYTFGLPARTNEGAAAAANRFGGEDQLLASRNSARVVQEYQSLRAAADVERAAGRPAPSNGELYAQAQSRIESAPNISRSNTPLTESRPTGTVTNPDDLYEQALRTGDINAMMQIDPPTALRMRANNGNLGRETTAASRRPAQQAGAGRNAPETTAASPGAGRNAPEVPLQRPFKTPEPTPAPNAEVPLGPDVDGGLGIVAGSGSRDPYFVPTNDTRSQIVSRANRDVSSLTDTGTYKAAADRLYQNFIDDLAPIQKKIDKTIERVTGKDLDAAESPYKMALASRGADMTSKQIITNGMVDSQGNVIGKSLKEVLAPIRTQRENVKFEDYLLNKHAITRAGRGEKVFRDQLNWTPQTAANKIAAYDREFPQFQEAAKDLYDFQKQLVDNWLVDSGMISRQQADAWLTENPFYVPNKRYFSDLEKTGKAFGGGGRGVASTSNPVKGYSATGSQRKIISPVEAIIENVDAYVKVAQRNKTMQQVYKYVTAYPDDFADFATIIRKPDKNLPADDLEALVADLGRDFDKGTQVFKMDTDNIVRVQLNGNTVRMKINDKPFLEALTAMGPQGSGWLLDTVGSLTNFFKKNTTSANPVFALTRNTSRDYLQGYVSSKTTNNPFVYFADYAKSISDILMNKKSYELYKNIGGGHSSSVAADRNLLAQSKRQLVGKKGPLNGLKRGYDTYENFLNAVETAPRLAEFKRTTAKGGSAQEALFNASDLTVNFKRRGRLARDIDKVFPYFNAAIQGFDQLARLYANPATRAKAITKSVVSIAIPAAAIYYLNKDDPNYQNLTDRQKDNFWNIPKGDGTFWKVALPLELGTLFSSVVQRGMEAMDGEGNEAFRGFGEQLRKAFMPPGVSGLFKDTDISDRLLGDTIFAPFTQLGANKNFAGAPIVPGYLERLSPELQADAKTSEIGKAFAKLPVVGKIANNSPKQADFLIKAYTGWIGQFATAATTPGTGVGKALEQQVSVDPTFSNDIGTEFYEYKDKLDQAYADREFKDLPNWYDNAMRRKFNDLQDRMSNLREKQRAIQSNTTLSNPEKEIQLRELQQKINEYAERGNGIARGSIPR